MNYLKYTPYAYLLAAAFFIFDAISKLNDGNNAYWLSFLFAALAIFVFFVRKRYAKRFEERSEEFKNDSKQ